ncbi:hypothetical protein D6745_03410, partial [Candidatus Woesearchaeota archaeon]
PGMCRDGFDNDDDGSADCADSDCDNTFYCDSDDRDYPSYQETNISGQLDIIFTDYIHDNDLFNAEFKRAGLIDTTLSLVVGKAGVAPLNLINTMPNDTNTFMSGTIHENFTKQVNNDTLTVAVEAPKLFSGDLDVNVSTIVDVSPGWYQTFFSGAISMLGLVGEIPAPVNIYISESESPSIISVSPNDTSVAEPNVIIIANVTDAGIYDSGIDHCEINVTGSAVINAPNCSATFTLTPGDYNGSVLVIDGAGNTISSTFNFTVVPMTLQQESGYYSVSLNNYPGRNYFDSSDTITFGINFSSSNGFNASDNCTVHFYNATDYITSFSAVLDNSSGNASCNASILLNGFNNSYYKFNVEVKDASGISLNSSFGSIWLCPWINDSGNLRCRDECEMADSLTIFDQTFIGGPPPNENVPTYFYANYTDASNQMILGAECNFSSLGTVNALMPYNATLELYQYNKTYTSSGTFDWNVTCSKSPHQTLTQSSVVVVNDTTPPIISLIKPVQNGNVTSNVLFKWSSTDNSLLNTTCTLFIDGSANESNLIARHGTPFNITIQNLTEGTHNWSVNCTDLANNTGNSSVWRFNVDVTPPSVTLIWPEDGYTLNDTLILGFNFSANDSSGVSNCTLVLDNVTTNYSAYSITNNVEAEIIAAVPSGEHNWSISCFDKPGNMNISEQRLINQTIFEGVFIIPLDNEELGNDTTIYPFVELRLYFDNTTAVECSFRNENSTWQEPVDCREHEFWLLSNGTGYKTVFYRINHTGGFITEYHDSIWFTTGEVPPNGTIPPDNLEIYIGNFTVTDEGTYTNDDTRLFASFSRPDDPWTQYFGLTVYYRFKLLENGTQIYPILESWQDLGTNNSVTLTNSDVTLKHGSNYTFHVQASHYVSFNPSRRVDSFSDGITIDTVTPVMDFLNSSDVANMSWTNKSSVTINWAASDSVSGIQGFSFIRTIRNDTVPDNILEGSGSSVTYNNIADRFYWFHIKPKDNAGNFGDPWTFGFGVDKSRPFPSLMQNPVEFSGSQDSIVFNWTPTTDISGIVDYELVVVDLNDNTTLFNSSVGNVTGKNVSVTQFTNYFAKVRAKNSAGLWSLWSDEAIGDITPPKIIFAKPNGTIVSDKFTIIAETDEDSVCYYVNNDSEQHIFNYTGGRFHESTDQRADSSDYTYEVLCFDKVGLQDSVNISFSIRTGYLPSTLSLNVKPTYFVGQVIKTNATVSDGSHLLGEITKDRWDVTLDGKLLNDYSLFDRGQGTYWIAFDAPIKEGTYSLKVCVDNNICDTKQINVERLHLITEYSGVSGTASQKVVYDNSGAYIIGLGSDATNVSPSSPGNKLKLDADTLDGKSYIFVTEPNAPIEQREEYLIRKEFDDLVVPSFGFPLNKKYFTATILGYDNVIILGNLSLDPGEYVLLMRNLGIDEFDNTRLEVRLKNETS